MKKYIVLLIFLFISLASALYIYSGILSTTDEKTIQWKHKEREIRSRLLAVPILLYHNIDGKGPFSVNSDVLRSHFQLIREKNIRVIPLHELIERLENPVPFDDKVIVLTFDDGFLSMYEKLWPLVMEFNYPVTLFVYTDFVHSRSKKMITWKKLMEMDRSLVDIQCHSQSHEDLTEFSEAGDLDSRMRLFEEIHLAGRIMELYLDKKIDYYAFPYGRYDAGIVEMAINSGYDRVFSTDYGSNVITRDNYCLNRQHVKRNYSPDYIESLIMGVR